jgi:hypothetical protein
VQAHRDTDNLGLALGGGKPGMDARADLHDRNAENGEIQRHVEHVAHVEEGQRQVGDFPHEVACGVDVDDRRDDEGWTEDARHGEH